MINLTFRGLQSVHSDQPGTRTTFEANFPNRQGERRNTSSPFGNYNQRRIVMSVYKIVELVGTSPTSWEEAAKDVIETASKTLRDIRIAEVDQLDLRVENGKIVEYRARVKLSFKYEGTA